MHNYVYKYHIHIFQQFSSSAFLGISANQQIAEFSRKFSVLGCPFKNILEIQWHYLPKTGGLTSSKPLPGQSLK